MSEFKTVSDLEFSSFYNDSDTSDTSDTSETSETSESSFLVEDIEVAESDVNTDSSDDVVETEETQAFTLEENIQLIADDVHTGVMLLKYAFVIFILLLVIKSLWKFFAHWLFGGV